MSVIFQIFGQNLTGAAFRDVARDANATADKVKGAFNAAFLGISVAGVATQLVALAGRAIETGDALAKAATKAGIGGGAMSELAHAAKMADVDLGTLSSSLRKMQVNLSEAATGAKAPQEALAALGIAISDIANLQADKQFELIADRIAMFKDPADRARAATELFGKAGADLLPLFEQGAAGIQKARQEALSLGVALNDSQVGRLAEADDAIKRLSASWDGFATTLTAKVAPALTKVFDALSGKSAREMRDPDILSQRMIQFARRELDMRPNMPADERKKYEDRIRFLQMGIDARAATPAATPPPAEGLPGFKAKEDPEARKARQEAERRAQAEKDRAFQVESQRLQSIFRMEQERKDQIDEIDAAIRKSADVKLDDLVQRMGQSGADAVREATMRMQEESALMTLTFESMFAPLEQGFQSMLNGVLTGTQTIGQAFARMGSNVAAVFANMAIQAGVNLLKMKLIALATGKATALAELKTSAATAAGNAYKAVVGIPVVGPVLAPAAAAVAYAGVLAFGAKLPSAAGGFDIPAGANPITQLHEKEMVLPAKYADAIRGMTEGGQQGMTAPTVELRGVSAGDFFVAARSDLIKVLNQGRRDFAFGY